MSTAAREPSDRLAARAEGLRLLVTSLAGRALRARFEIDDLVQDVFVRALSEPQRLPPEDADLERYLALLARRVVVDAARRARAAKREGELSLRGLAGDAASGTGSGSVCVPALGSGPATRAARHEASEGLVEAYLKLAPEHRRVLGLRQFQGLTAAECGRRMGRSEAAVHSLYRRALEAWGERLGPSRAP